MATPTPKASSKSPTIRRILREAAEVSNAPSPDYFAEPLEEDLFEWHFTLRGPPNSSYSDGLYHGRIVLPPTYPLRPPSFRFTTPSGRFEANREICLSISGHHEETWQPAWGIRTALVASTVLRLRSFMETDARGQLGGLEATDAVRRRLAKDSANFKCLACARSNADIMRECEERATSASNPQADVSVPKELSMGWRDEMGAKDPVGNSRESDAGPRPSGDKPMLTRRDSDSDELAESFVQTTPAPTRSSPPPSSSCVSPGHQPLPPPTRTVPIHQPPRHPTAAQHRRPVHDGVPLWMDRVIVVLVVLLTALLLKILLGL